MTERRTIMAIDSDRWACATFAANFPDTDVRCSTVREQIDSLPACDWIIGGPPCQGFSTAGKGLGAHDLRNGWPEAIAAVERVKPRMFLFENVPGMMREKFLRHIQGYFTALERLGYVVESRILDAVNHGVPQFRERVWWWGIRADLYRAGMRHAWPKPTHQWPWPESSMFGGGLLPAVTVGWALNIPHRQVDGVWFAGDGSESRVMGGGRNHPDKNPDGSWRRDKRDITGEPSTTIAAVGFALHGGAIPRIHEYRWSDAMLEKHPPASPASPAPTVQAKWFKGGAEGLLRIDGASGWSGQRVLEPSAPGPTVGGGSNQELLRIDDPKHPVNSPDRPAVTQRGGGNGHSAPDHTLLLAEKPSRDGRTWESRHPTPGPHEPMPTVRARSPRDGGRCTEQIINDGIRVRRLTPPECLRLQSGPDDFRWPDGITKTAMHRVVGNGWACALAARLAEQFQAVDPNGHTTVDLFSGGGLGAVGWHGRYWSYQSAGAVA